MCFACQSCETNYVEAPSEARVYSYTVVRHASHPAVEKMLPYVVAVVDFPDMPGVRLITNLTDIDSKKVSIGMRCTLWWDDIGDGMFLPRFRPLDAVTSAA